MVDNTNSGTSPVIVVHGGAWAVPDKITEETLQGVKRAAKIGYASLLGNGTCVDAVVAAVSSLEDNPLYDAGRGSLLNSDEDIEMHAIVMRGDTLDCGGVVGVKNVKNPVQVARLVMDETEHCALTGVAALELARKHKMEEMPIQYFTTESAKEEWESLRKFKTTVHTLFDNQSGHDTVGAVALDRFGNLACATSTGGITMQLPGRVSDSPLAGAGGYADNETLAISTTGHGESIIKTSLARLASLHLEQGMTPQESVNKGLDHMKRRVDGRGGAISVDRTGRVGIAFTTIKMSWAVIGGKLEFADKTDSQIAYGIMPGEIRTVEHVAEEKQL